MKSKMLFFALIAILLSGFVSMSAFAQNTTYTLAVVAGDNQSAWVGTHFNSPLQVTVTDGTNPVGGVSVTFTAPPTGASAFLTAPGSAYSNTLTVTTDANGVASANATANCKLSTGSYQVTAMVGGQSATFNLSNTGQSNPLCIDSNWEIDWLYPHPEDGSDWPSPNTPTDSSVTGYWWRDTSDQNTLSQHAREFNNTVVPVYTSPIFNVYEYIIPRGTNITLLTAASNYFIVGCGGGASEATLAKYNLSSYISGKTLRGIIMTDTRPETLFGCTTWKGNQTNVALYASAGFDDSMDQMLSVSDEYKKRMGELFGTDLNWDYDSFLGSGEMGEYLQRDTTQTWINPTALISTPTDIYLDGNPIQLIPGGGSSDGLMVYLPMQGILDTGKFLGSYLPDAGGLLPSDGFGITALTNELEYMRSLSLSTLLTSAGKPIMGSTEVLDYLLAHKDALTYIRDQAIIKMQAGWTLDQAAAAIQLPDSLASRADMQEFTSDVPSIVHAVWNEYLGWWGGNTTELASTLTEDTKAQILAETLGGVDQLVEAAKQAELNARDLAGAEKALYLADAAYRAAWTLPDVDTTLKTKSSLIYAQVLRKNALLQKSAYKRNHYLTVRHDLPNIKNYHPSVWNEVADVTVEEDAIDTTIDLTEVFDDSSDDTLVITAVSSRPDLVTVTVTGLTLTLSFSPDQNGSATVTLTATDTMGAWTTDDFSVTVNPVNDAPWADDQEITMTAGTSQTIPLSYGDLETAQADLEMGFTAPSYGGLSGISLQDIIYTPQPGFSGEDAFHFSVTDRGDPDGCTGSALACAAPQTGNGLVTIHVLPAPSGSISGQVFNDANANGSLDAGESGLAGVTVQLQDANGNELETITTAVDGQYTFTGLEAGSYQVYAPKDADRAQTTANPIAVNLATTNEVKTGGNIGSVVSADIKVNMSTSVISKAIIYTITIVNDGPADATNATLSDALPSSVAYVSVMSSTGTCTGGKTVNCSFGTIAKDGSVIVTIKVNRVNTKVAIVNTASVSSNTFDIDMVDNSATATTP
jgi:uncharacterized repeat protein (TIGR01451 family)